MTDFELLDLLQKFDGLLNFAIRKSIATNTKITRWVNSEDIKQDILLRMVKSCRSTNIIDSNHFLRIMMMHLRHAIVDFYRKMYGPNGWASNIDGKTGQEPLEDVTDKDLPKEYHRGGPPITTDEWIDFHESVEHLPEIERTTFSFYFYGGLNEQQISKMMACSERTVRRRLTTAMIKLQRRINDQRC